MIDKEIARAKNDLLFLMTEKLWGKVDYSGALKIGPWYDKMDSEKQLKEEMTEDE